MTIHIQTTHITTVNIKYTKNNNILLAKKNEVSNVLLDKHIFNKKCIIS